MNIMIVGVGGQGTLLASRILGKVALACGYDCKVSEVHGMSQRGGSVETFVKFGDKVYSPIIGVAEADIILAFEALEGYRALKYLKRGGKLIINTQNIDPMPVIVGEAKYPEGIFDKIREKNVEFTQVNATEIAKACGNIKAVNVVLIGVLAKNTKIDKEVWIKAIEDTVPEKFKEVNVNAFLKGYEI